MSELAVNRRNTTAFIAARPTTIALIPVAVSQTASGGRVTGDLPARPAQVMRLIEQGTSTGNSPGRVPTTDGHQLKVTWQLLGEWDAEMEIGDHWDNYQIQELLPYNGYERRAKVVEYGTGA
jgi:hypothetical protein